MRNRVKIAVLFVCVLVISAFCVGTVCAKEPVRIIACSDFQNMFGHSVGTAVAKDILLSLEENLGISKADGLLFCGDYDKETYNNAEETLKGINALKEAFSGKVPEENMVLLKGNHDPSLPELSASGKNDTSDYGVFVINETDLKWYGNDEAVVKNTASSLKAYFSSKIKSNYKKPIFVVSHLPLHYNMRTKNDGDGTYAKYIFDEINYAGEKGLNIIFLYGHNHSHGWDDYIGGASVFLKKGDSILIPDFSQESFVKQKLNFTYMNAGYIGYYIEENYGADKQLTMTLFEITDDEVKISRFNAKGLHTLKAKGIRNASKSESGYDPDVRVYDSPQVISLKGNARDEIVIIYTNDTHCEVEGELGFADISAIKAIEEAFGNEVILLDAGDAVQGGAIGSLSKGSYIIEIMNEVGYDFAVLGNHEFDYGIERLKELSSLAQFPYISSNIISLEDNKALFEPYYMKNIGETDIAFVGVTTPHTISSTSPEYFKNEKGEIVYSFSVGEDFYNVVQENIDKAKKDGAETVIAVTHLGVDDADSPYTSKDLIENTSGLTAVIDAHSHTVIDGDIYKDKENEDVLLTSTGSKFENIGVMKISGDTIETQFVNKQTKEQGIPQDGIEAYGKTSTFIEEIKDKYNAVMEEVVAKTEYDLVINDPAKYSEETGAYRIVRNSETNLANLCADAYRYALDTDIAIINGGGVRADIQKGDMTYGDLLNVNPFGNELCVIEVTGQQMIDALEHGARSYPSESGAFLHASGLTYEIDENIKSSVELDENGIFKGVSGSYRVKNVKVSGNPIDKDKTYTLGGSAFTLLDSGDGFSMFEGSKVLKPSVCIDCDALIKYTKEYLNGVVGKEYENPYGEGRIKIVVSENSKFSDIENHWAREEIEKAFSLELINGVTQGRFDPDGGLTRAMFVSVIHRLEGSPNAVTDSYFADVSDNSYYLEASLWASENNIMLGTGNGNFEPDKLITREEMATVIMRYCAFKGNGPVAMWAIKLDYTDLPEISDWAIEPVMFNKINNIMKGNPDNSFNPTGNATRAEAVIVIIRTNEFLSAVK